MGVSDSSGVDARFQGTDKVVVQWRRQHYVDLPSPLLQHAPESTDKTAGSNEVAWQYKTVRDIWITDCGACVGVLRDAAEMVR